MVETREFIRESNAIENVDDESAVMESLKAWEYLSDQSTLSHEVVQAAHERIMMNRQPNLAGEYRDVQVYVKGEETARPPPVVIASEMDKLLSWTPANPLEAIEWHVAFEQIHPFEDGNGSVGRLIYLWHCTELLEVEPILWRAKDRSGYYELFQSPVEIDERSN